MIRALALAGAMILGLTLPTLAEVATTNGLFVNIRSGPGMKYEPVCLAWPGVRFTVKDCEKGWCAVSYRRSEGYISTHYIEIQK